jgi:hypothetical protein
MKTVWGLAPVITKTTQTDKKTRDKCPKLTLGPTQPHIQWVPEALHQHKKKKPGHKGSLLSSAKVMKECNKTSHLLDSS